MAVFAGGKIEAYVGPPGLGAHDDLEAVIVEFIAGARCRLDIAVQELDSEAIARAILTASWRGVRVTLFVEQDYLRSPLRRDSTGVPIPPTPKPGETPAQALERAQWQASVDGVTSAARSILIRALVVRSQGSGHPLLKAQEALSRATSCRAPPMPTWAPPAGRSSGRLREGGGERLAHQRHRDRCPLALRRPRAPHGALLSTGRDGTHIGRPGPFPHRPDDGPRLDSPESPRTPQSATRWVHPVGAVETRSDPRVRVAADRPRPDATCRRAALPGGLSDPLDHECPSNLARDARQKRRPAARDGR